MYRWFALLFAIFFIAMGVLALIPGLQVYDHLFDTFHVDQTVSVIWLVTGALSFLFFLVGRTVIRIYFQLAGIVYGLWAILGMVYQETMIFGILPNSMPNVWFNVIVGVIFLILGFSSPSGD